MKHYDEELQNNIEQGKTGFGPDEAAYEAVFNTLRKEPAHLLPASFADKVATKILAKQQKTSAWEYVWMAFGFALLLAACIVILLETNLKLDFGLKLEFGFLEAMAGYKGLFIFALGFVIFLQWLDKRLVRQQPFKGSKPLKG